LYKSNLLGEKKEELNQELSAELSKTSNVFVDSKFTNLSEADINNCRNIFKTPNLLGEKRYEIIKNSAMLLAKIGNDKTIDTLISALDKKDYTADELKEITYSLGFSKNKKAIDPLLGLLKKQMEERKKIKMEERPTTYQLFYPSIMDALSKIVEKNDTQSSEVIEEINEFITQIEKKPDGSKYDENDPMVRKYKKFLLRIEKGHTYEEEIEKTLEKQYPELIFDEKLKNVNRTEKSLILHILSEIMMNSPSIVKRVNAFVVLNMNIIDRPLSIRSMDFSYLMDSMDFLSNSTTTNDWVRKRLELLNDENIMKSFDRRLDIAEKIKEGKKMRIKEEDGQKIKF